MAVLQLTSRFLTDFYILLDDWAAWATGIAGDWPDDPAESAAATKQSADYWARG